MNTILDKYLSIQYIFFYMILFCLSKVLAHHRIVIKCGLRPPKQYTGTQPHGMDHISKVSEIAVARNPTKTHYCTMVQTRRLPHVRVVYSEWLR